MDAWWIRIWKTVKGAFVRALKFPPPADPLLLNQVKGWFAEQLSNYPEIPVERRGEYARAAGVIFERMTPTALLRLRMNTRDIRFYPNLDELSTELARTELEVRALLVQGHPIGGAYELQSRRLHLDGGVEDVPDHDIVGLYAHELTHAINGPARQISASPAWRQAWEVEIVRKILSPRALVNPQEGFAELGRFMYSGYFSRGYLQRHFPLCVEVWRGFGIW